MVRCPPSIWQWSASTPLSPASASLPASVRSSSSSSSCPAAAPEQRRADAKESEEDELTSVAEERASRIKGRDAAVNRLPSSSSCSSCSSCFSPLHLLPFLVLFSVYSSTYPPHLLFVLLLFILFCYPLRSQSHLLIPPFLSHSSYLSSIPSVFRPSLRTPPPSSDSPLVLWSHPPNPLVPLPLSLLLLQLLLILHLPTSSSFHPPSRTFPRILPPPLCVASDTGTSG